LTPAGRERKRVATGRRRASPPRTREEREGRGAAVGSPPPSRRTRKRRRGGAAPAVVGNLDEERKYQIEVEELGIGSNRAGRIEG
jgi:hypothetical protein